VVGIIGFVFFSFFWIIPLLGIIILKRVLPARKSSMAATMANPPASPEVARLAQLEREEAELKRKIEARR
jgi:hypothetical protein